MTVFPYPFLYYNSPCRVKQEIQGVVIGKDQGIARDRLENLL